MDHVSLITSLNNQITSQVHKLFSKNTLLTRWKNNELEIIIESKNLPYFFAFLKQHTLSNVQQLLEIAVIDQITRKNRFKINYVVSSIIYNNRFVISTETDEVTIVPSVINTYDSATWLEREVWDLYGIHFEGNNDLRRIVTDYGFKGHPLRKDFPLTGFLEVYYNDEEKKIVYEPVEVAQEYRVFCLQNPWIHSQESVRDSDADFAEEGF
jgi:NADH:ubiquinone oxidoreductase subunit C